MSTAPPSGDDSTTFPTATTTQPWSEFISLNSLSFPVSLSDATARLTRNLTHYKGNYINVTLIIFFISLFFRPLSLLILFLTCLAWYFLFFSRRSDFEVCGFFIDDRAIAAVLGVITVIALFYANVWGNLFISLGVSVVFVCLHGVFRDPSFGDGESPYGGLLDAEAGAYAQI